MIRLLYKYWYNTGVWNLSYQSYPAALPICKTILPAHYSWLDFHLGFQVEHSLLLARIRDRSAIREDMHAPVTDATFGDFKAF